MNWEAIAAANEKRLRDYDAHPDLIEEFLYRVGRVRAGDSGMVAWDSIGDLPPSDYVSYDSLGRSVGTEATSGLAVIKLNGGLGTSMGLERAKSLMPVKDGRTFLDVILFQLGRLRAEAGSGLPLLLMNSFNTRADTLAAPGVAAANAHLNTDIPVDFLQNRVPRITADGLLPIGDGSSPEHWCPPGHGDIFLALRITGILDRLLAAGFRQAFLSNGDNLGALADPAIADYFVREQLDFLSEVTPKTKADLKGGVLYRPILPDGSQGPIELLETAQVEPAHLVDFQDVNRFAYFNINNLWVNLEALRDRLNQGSFHLSLIRNPKQVGGTDILQLETAMGAAIGKFRRSRVMIVPRTRFAPVKTTADLLVRRSDAYVLLDQDGALVANPRRRLGEPVVALSDHYKKIGDFDRLVSTVPSLVDVGELRVEGPVRFDVPVAFAGRVVLRNQGSEPVAISSLGRSRFADEEIELGS